MTQTARKALEVARRHLEKVEAAWDAPTDWADLALYGFYCLESCVVAAAVHLGLPRPKSTHPAKLQQARRLAASHGLPAVDGLLAELNDRRKFEAYGDSELAEDDDLDAEDVANEVRGYFEAVEAMLGP